MTRTLAVTAAALALLGGVAATVARADAPPQDENWLQTSISGDRFEIAGGKIALRRAATSGDRALGRRLMQDHMKSLASAVRLAQQLGVGVPPAATPSEQWELNRLKNMPRSWFDVQYAAIEVKDHNQDIEETGFEARKGELWQVRAEAKKDLPMLNMHLKLSKATLAAAEAANER
jgi:predicted outer membrane protein